MAARKVHPQGPSELPPAGYERDEELRRREDTLEQTAEELSNSSEHYAIDPEVFKPEREMQHLLEQFNELEVSNADPSYVYCWVNSGFNGLYVKLKCAERWEVVQGEMEEAIEMKGIGTDTTRRLGDVILMRCRKDIFLGIMRKRRAAAEHRMQTIDQGLVSLGEKHRDKGIIVQTPDNIDERRLRMMEKRAQAKATAEQWQDKWIREGRMPGMAMKSR